MVFPLPSTQRISSSPFPPSCRCIAHAFTVTFQPEFQLEFWTCSPAIARGFAQLGNRARGTCVCDPHSRSVRGGNRPWRGMEWRTWTVDRVREAEENKTAKETGRGRETRRGWSSSPVSIRLSISASISTLSFPPPSLCSFLVTKLRDVRFWILSREEETICAEENYLDSDEIWTDDTVACWGPCNAQGNPSVMALFLDVRTRLSERVAFKVIRRLYFRCTRDTVGRRIILRLRIIWTRFTFVWRKRRMGFRRFG